ncbi:MAG: hypothetical protein M1828_004962 [Chrysothrix sp. TS-e1954]|nr:MAG: hypothetical protein M1828_004962 [Chrysothrix sp. TS-e1954]
MSGSKSASAVLDSRLQQEIVGPTKCLKQTGSSSSTVSFSDQKTDIMEHLEVGQRPVQALEVAGDTKTPPDSSVIDQNSVEENLLDDLKMTSDADTKSHPTSALLVVRKTSNMKKSPPPYLIGSTVDLNVNNQKNPSQVASPTLTHSKEDLSGNMKLQPAVSQGIRSPVHLNDRDSHKVVKTSPDPTSAQPQTFRPSLLKACKTTTTPDATTDTSIAHSESMKKPAFSASAALKELQTSKPPAISPSSSKTSSLPAYALRQREWEEKMSYKPAIYIPQANVKYDWQMTSTSFATLNTTNEPTNFKYKPKTSQNARNSSSCDDQSVTTPEQTSQMGERISQPPKAPKLPPKDASEVVTTDKKTDDGCPSSPSVAKDSVDPLPVAINSKDDGGRPKTLKCAIVQQQQSKSEGKDNLLPTQHSPRCPSNSSNRILEDKGLSAGDGSTPPLANDACSHDHRVASKPIATTEPIPHATGTTTDERKSKASAFLSTNDSPEESVATKPSSVLCGEDRSKKRKADDQGIYGGQHRAFKRRTCRKLGMGNNSSMLLACCG